MIESTARGRCSDDLALEAVAEMARIHARSLEAYAQTLCGDAHDAQDLVQQTFERVMRTAPERLPQHNRHAWLCTVLRRLFLDGHRHDARRPQRVDVELDVVTVADVDADSRAPAWYGLTATDVHAALELLDEPFASVFCLHELEGRPYADIAHALGISVNTVGTRMLRARRKLRVALTEHLGARGADARTEFPIPRVD